MNIGCISHDRILEKLDGYLGKKDYTGAERHLLYWLSEAIAVSDHSTELLMRNELMGLYRKLGKNNEALNQADTAIARIDELNIRKQVGSATTYLNAATVYKAFSMADKALPLFSIAREIYETELDSNDSRLGGLYNNMGLALVDLKRFEEAKELYLKAIEIMGKGNDEGELEVAITYLNLASATEAELGLIDGDEAISEYLSFAWNILDSHKKQDGYYAFVCEKCASVFGYYGHFIYEEELLSRARRIYEGS
ncbi:MAG: tetratricopeptide repeat protein [Ruminococcaceae bacterium]|nr:tetratricopeptide repeat protein [Oscillospiraceae bacterium]